MKRRRFTVELQNEINEILEKMAEESHRSKVGVIRYLIDKEREENRQKGGNHGRQNQ